MSVSFRTSSASSPVSSRISRFAVCSGISPGSTAPFGSANTVPAGRELARRVTLSALIVFGSMIATCHFPCIRRSTTPPAEISRTVFGFDSAKTTSCSQSAGPHANDSSAGTLTSMRRRLFYCDNHDIGLPAGHKFPTPKYRKVRELLAADGAYDFEPAPFARRETIERVHDPVYVEAFINGTLDPQVIRRIGFPWSEGLVRRTLASVGGTLCATQDALDRRFGGNLAGGTHHAFRSEGSGFCVFNDIAVATLWL